MDFQVEVKNRKAEAVMSDGAQPLLVNDNTDQWIVFSFDEEWPLEAMKTARFVYRKENGLGDLVSRDLPIDQNRVEVPLLHNVKEVWIGVIMGAIRTTTPARFTVLPSIASFAADEEELSELDERIVQTMGSSTQLVMSQKAVTDAIGAVTGKVNTLQEAVDALMIKQSATGFYATLEADGWSEQEIRVSVEGMTANSIVLVAPAPDDTEVYCEHGILCVKQEEGALIFHCDSAPTKSLTVQVVMI